MNPNKILTAQTLTMFVWKDLVLVDLSAPGFWAFPLKRLVTHYSGAGMASILGKSRDPLVAFEPFFRATDLNDSLKNPIKKSGLWRWEGTLHLNVLTGELLKANGKWARLDGESYESWCAVGAI